jgi:hypothetical protein
MIIKFHCSKDKEQDRVSLSYDIIIAHGGELNVETKEGEFAEFIIQLLTGHEK